MRRLDVVAELAAHQQHLIADRAPDHTVVLALPPPELCTLVAVDAFAALRRQALDALAGELGGGDGPLPIVEYTGGALDALWQRGVRALVVYGGVDRPGHMRAVRYRWPGALREAGASALDALFGEPVRAIAPGVIAIAAGASAPRDAACVLAAVDDDGDPARVRTHDRVWPYAIDRQRRLGPWSGVLPAPGLYGTAAGAAIRARWDAHWTALGHPDVVRRAALQLDPVLEEALRERAASPRRPDRRAHVIAITGIDGAGKSSQAGWLAETLRARGARVDVVKLYRQGAFLELANQLGARTRRGAPLAAFVTSRAVKLVDSLRVYRDHIAASLAACDAVIFDRHVETHLAAAESQLGWDLTGHPALAPFPAADVRFWLALDPEVALQRRHERGEPASADEHATGLAGYAEVFARLAAGPGEVVLDAGRPAAENRRTIEERATEMVGAPRGDPALSRLVPSRGPPRRPAVRCAVHITGSAGRDDVELGADLLVLRAALEDWCGPVAGRAPEAFWLEAYAAQLVLDLWTLEVTRARLALWPGAVAAMASHGSLEMLRELSRMLAPLVEIESYDPRPAGYVATFAALGAAPTAAARLARDYARQLERLADEAGWTPAT